MGKTIFAAVIAALVTSIVTVMVMSSIQSEQRAADAAARKTVDDTAQVERERLDRRMADIERRVAAPRAGRRESGETPADAGASETAPAASAGGAPAIAPDGTPYVSQAQMEAFAKAHGVRVGEAPQVFEDVKPVEKKTLEEIAREQGLSAGEEANLRNILRESEEELVRCIFGTKSMDEIKTEVLAAKDDPDKQEQLMTTAVQNAIGNVGKLMTLEKRTKKRVDEVLGPERGKKFMDAPRQSLIAPELEEVFEALGD
jgi:hypothetical protein